MTSHFENTIICIYFTTENIKKVYLTAQEEL